MLKKFIDFILELTKVVVISLIIIFPIRFFIIQPFYVKGASMEPSFYDSEYLIIDEISYRFEEPQRGDVIVFRYPRNPQEYFIKRIIGLPKENIQIKEGDIYIYNGYNPNGLIMEEEYLKNNVNTYSSNNKMIELSEDEYYVLGDNRTSSQDSRNFGSVDRSFIIGRVLFRGWPLDRMGLIHNEQLLMYND